MEINTNIKTDKKVIKQADRSLDPQKEKKVKKGPGVSDSKNDGQGVDIVPTADYKINAAGKKYRAHRIVFNKGEDDGRKGVTEQMKKTFNTFVSQHTPELTEEELKELEQELNEVLGKSAEAGDWIHDFVHSDNPKFQGKSKEKRKQMALAAYYAAQRNEELVGGQKKLDKNKNGKLDAQDFKLLRKEEVDQIDMPLNEAYDADDYEATHEKSQFGGYRAKLTNKKTGKDSYLGGTAYHKPEHAEGEAKAYKDNYRVASGKVSPGASYSHDRAVAAYRKSAKEAGHIREGWDDMLASVKKNADTQKTSTATKHDVKKTATGTVYTKQRDADGMSKEFKRDNDQAKRGRGRPKKNSFSEAAEFLVNLDEETFDSLMEDGFDLFFETYQSLDEISKTTLASYVKKANRSAVASRKIAGDFEHMADKSRKPSMKAEATSLADKWKSRTFKRSNNIEKAVDRLTK